MSLLPNVYFASKPRPASRFPPHASALQVRDRRDSAADRTRWFASIATGLVALDATFLVV
jgi:hypothetical protein